MSVSTVRSSLSLFAAACAAFSVVAAVAVAGEGEVAPPPSLDQIADGVWVHKSYKVIEPWGPFLSQGMVLEKNGIVFLIDTAWNDKDTETLLFLIKQQFGRLPFAAIITHAHEDKMGGVSALRQYRVETHALRETNEDAKARGLLRTQFSIDPARRYTVFESASRLNFYDQNYYPEKRWFHVFYPGPGHTRDNIVVYYAPAKVLFGGCLIRPGNATDLGNTADADIGHWADAVRAVAARFPDAEIVIPSHGAVGGRELLDHTIALAEAAANAQ